jgi:thiamine-phosphate diphosphorylase
VKGAGRLHPSTLRLVAITESLLADGPDGLVARALGAVEAGATMLQLRLKDESVRTLVEVAKRLRAASPGVPVIVNGRADAALAAGADGVHLGTDDLSSAALRRVVPAGFIIGASVAEVDDARLPLDADYVAVGPVFGPASAAGSVAPIGLARLSAFVARCPVPVLALGGITPENAAQVLAAGAAGLGVISVLPDVSDPMMRVRALLAALDASGR